MIMSDARKKRRERYWKEVEARHGKEEMRKRRDKAERRRLAKEKGKRLCSTCEQEKDLDAFYGKSTYCKECYVLYQEEYRKSNYSKEQRRKWQRSYNLRAKYGISVEEYDQMLRDQDSACAICMRSELEPGSPLKLVVDHDHETGKVRGLLCDFCNRALGVLGDRLESPMFQRVLRYLE